MPPDQTLSHAYIPFIATSTLAMSTPNFLRLLLLGAIWGTSFMLMRICVPELGPLPTTFLRALLGGLALYFVARAAHTDFGWRSNARIYLVIGLFNTAIPFALFAWSALHIPSAYMATMNSLAPIFTALFGVLLLAERLTPARIVASVLGLCGVALLVGVGPTAVNAMTVLGVLASIGAAACYGYAATYTRMKAGAIAPLAVATASQFAAALVLLPLALPGLPQAAAQVTLGGAVAVGVLGVACTGIAYALFFHLIAAEGSSKAITVTFLVPATASIWALIFLGEAITAGTVLGIAIVLTATAVALGVAKRGMALVARFIRAV